jgi:DNA polymerase-3 subunit alpha
MEAEKNKLLEGFVNNGMSGEKAQKFWELIEPFAAYGFNKAHAASYGRVAYQTAYMKANFPVEYMSAILTAESGDVEKISEIVKECQSMEIDVLPPDVNESFGGFTVVKNNKSEPAIRFGLYTIKNLGTDIANSIIEERKTKGAFKSLADFFERINHKNLNKKSVEALAKSGAMDNFEERNMIINNLETLISFNKEARGDGSSQDSLFGSIGGVQARLTLIPQEPATQIEKLAWEKELLGLYISGHPLDAYREKIEKVGTLIEKVKSEVKANTQVTVAAVIDSVRIIMTKNNERMAFLKLSDYSGSIEAVVFSHLFNDVKDILVENNIIAFKGKVTNRNGEKSIMIENLKKI